MLVFPHCSSPTQDPTVPPEAGKKSLWTRVMELALNQKLHDHPILALWTDGVILIILTDTAEGNSLIIDRSAFVPQGVLIQFTFPWVAQCSPIGPLWEDAEQLRKGY